MNERGVAQAEQLAKALSGESISAVYSSPLQRARATAAPLAEALGIEVETAPGLIEMDVGEVENRTFGELRDQYADFLREWRSERVADLMMPGGESLRQVQERAWRAVVAIRDTHADETVAAVSHNFVILTLLCRVIGIDLARFRGLRQDLAAVSEMRLDGDRTVLVRMNDRCHLPDTLT